MSERYRERHGAAFCVSLGSAAGRATAALALLKVLLGVCESSSPAAPVDRPAASPVKAPREGEAAGKRPAPEPGSTAADPLGNRSGVPGSDTPREDDTEKRRAQAVKLLREGNRAVDAGDYRVALGKFEKAYGLYPSPRLLFNLAQVHNELGRLVDALEHYEHFTREFPKAEGPELFDLAHRRIFQLRGQIVSLRVETNVPGADVTVDGRRVGETPLEAPIRLLPGPHAILVSKAGHERQVVERDLKAGDTLLRLELLTEAEAVAKRKEVQKLAEEHRIAEEQLRREKEASRMVRRERLARFRISGWAVLGTGLAILATGAGFGVHSLVKKDYVESLPEGTPWSEVAADYRAAENSRLGFFTGLGLGAAVVATGAILLYVKSRMERHEEVLPAPGPAPSATPHGTSTRPRLRILPTAGPGGLVALLTLEY